MQEAFIDIQLVETPIQVKECVEMATAPSCGGLSVFIGTVRNNTAGRPVVRLEFEAYAPMAISEIKKIAQTIQERWSAQRIVIHHRTGALEVEGIAVLIAIATPHRKAAFEACQYAIDTLKETVPIWKKEIFEDGEVWVSATP